MHAYPIRIQSEAVKGYGWPTPAAFRYERQGELGLFYWVEGKSAHGGPTGYAIVGTLPREKLLALAEAIYRQQP